MLANVYNQEDEGVEVTENLKDWLKRNELYFMPADLINDVVFEKMRKIKTLSEPHTQIFGYKVQNKGVYYILPDSFKKNFAKAEA